MRIPLVALAAGTILAAAAWCGPLFDQGQDALRANQPEKAKSLLEAAINEDPQNGKTYLYLGIADMQLGSDDDALQALKQGLAVSGQYADTFYFDIANVYFIEGQNTLAEGMYTKALERNPSFADAYLNRANARMNLKSFDGAVADYTVYLTLAPDAPQRDSIERLIGLLGAAKTRAEQEKIAAEKAREAEAARQKSILAGVLQQLQSSSADTKNLQAGNAAIQDNKANLGLDD